MANVLVIHSYNTFPLRPTLHSLLYSFRNYSKHKVFYYQLFSLRKPRLIKKANFDVVVFHNSVTLCSEKDRYHRLIEYFLEYFGSVKIKVALFQDEYFNTDMSVLFINELGINHVYTVAPVSEWSTIYNGVNENTILHPMLTGYINEKNNTSVNRILAIKKDTDIGYRVVWEPLSVVLGKFGYEKVKIAELFTQNSSISDFSINVKIGAEYIISGNKWYDFLQSCRYVLGTESGSSVLDRDGSLRESVADIIKNNPSCQWEELYKMIVWAKDDTVKLFTISPRHFEAVQAGSCQILYEGAYSGVLIPWRHYIPLKKDHSNFYEIVNILDDEEYRREIVKNAYTDLVDSKLYTYTCFVKTFFNTLNLDQDSSQFKNQLVMYLLSRIREWFVWRIVGILTLIKKRVYSSKNSDSKIFRYLLYVYQKIRK